MSRIREATAAREWWANVQRKAKVYFDLIKAAPSSKKNPPLDVTSAMVDLHDAQKAVQQLICPLEAETARGKILSSMRLLQIALADLLADNADESNRSYEKAAREYEEALKKMRSIGLT